MNIGFQVQEESKVGKLENKVDVALASISNRVESESKEEEKEQKPQSKAKKTVISRNSKTIKKSVNVSKKLSEKIKRPHQKSNAEPQERMEMIKASKPSKLISN